MFDIVLHIFGLVGEAAVFWDTVVILDRDSSVLKVPDHRSGMDNTFPVRTPPARDDQVVVPNPYFLYNDLDKYF